MTVSVSATPVPLEFAAAEVCETAGRVAGLDWTRLGADLDARGYGLAGRLLSDQACEALIAAYDEDARYRSRIVMARHGFGQGEYSYYAYPLPDLIQTLRRSFYTALAPVADRWRQALGLAPIYPSDHVAFLDHCRAAGQTRPTPLILRYREGDYNCLHQDLYGEVVFPLQVAILLNEPGEDFTGGEFVLTEQRPRQQSRAEVIPLRRGEAVIFAVAERPVQGQRGYYRAKLRHGVSRLRSGSRCTLGIICHDAR